MIKKLKKLENYGVFKNYRWNTVHRIRDFNDKNIIYGWNYSGKTTISRLFQEINDSTRNSDFQNAKFEIEEFNGNIITEETITSNNLKCAVFNSDFIERNLSWDPSTEWDAIAFDVGDNVTLRNEIETIEKEIVKILGDENSVGRVSFHNERIKKFNRFEESKFRDQAKDIRHIVYSNRKNFDKGHFKRTKPVFDGNLDQFIIKDQDRIQKLTDISNATKSLQTQPLIQFKFNYNEFKVATTKLLLEEPAKEIVIDILESNTDLYSWVELGMKFEENNKVCSYCNNPISTERINNLNDYYSNQSKILRDRITKGINIIESEIVEFENLNMPKSKNDFSEQHREAVHDLMEEYEQMKSLYIDDLNYLLSELRRKVSGNIFTRLEFVETVNSLDKIKGWLLRFNRIISSHNKFLEDFDSNQEKAQDELINHLVSQYLKDQEYFELKRKSELAEYWLSGYGKYVKIRESNVKEIRDSLKNITAGKSKLNEIIKKFLNRDDISIDVTEDDKFILKRGAHNAKNLSEGEKTAIAFSYFLILLESKISDRSIFDTIIFIDDPISSLDSNHISQVYSLINSFFFRRIDQDNPERVVNCFKQIFISTHNFSFFSFLKDSSQLKRLKKITTTEGVRKISSCSYYLINRQKTDESIILPMSNSIMKYKSEYVHLFDIIYEFHNSTTDERDNYLILIPNALRRFIEIYTLMKIPSEPASVENRLHKLVDDVNEYKMLNHFSHFTTFEKMTKHDELIMNLPKATEELFNLLKLDQMHYDSLVKAIGK